MGKTEHILEFDKVKEKWMQLALTESAKAKIINEKPCLSETELVLRQKETTEARMILEKEGTPPLVSMEGLEELLGIAERGDCLTAPQLEQIEFFLTAVKRLKDYLNRCKQLELSLPFYGENLDSLTDIREAIHVQIRNGRVDDYASKALHTIRSDIEKTQNRMKEKADAIIKGNKECMSDSYSTFRSGHLCVPVKKEYKFKIAGSVIDKSATGSTLFIEPAAVAKYSEELQLLKIDEENEERRILYTLTAMVAESLETEADRTGAGNSFSEVHGKGGSRTGMGSMNQNLRIMEKLDYIFSKGKLSLDMDGAAPSINTQRHIVLKGARHPLMDKEICVPQDFILGQEYRGIVITGPNTGGKTVAIKTVALNCLMAQCGLHVTCKEADICMNSNYLCDIGDGQNLSENLSTFSAHITNVLDILKQISHESLVVMDELGSGTDPAEGMGIAIAILDELKKSGCLFLVTTHYPEIKEYAKTEEEITNARMTFDRESLKPTYQMVIGEAGESCAFYIAARLGMPGAMLKTAAQAAYGAYRETLARESAGRTADAEKGKASGGRTTDAEKGEASGGRTTDAEKGEASGGRTVDAEKEEASGGRTVDAEKEEASGGKTVEAVSGEVSGRESVAAVSGMQLAWATEDWEKLGSSRTESPNRIPPSRIQKKKMPNSKKDLSGKFRIGDSVMVYPDKKIGIVCEPVNEKGVLRVQLPGRKIWINHKRVKLHVAAEELYPDNYDFSIVFDTVENRKLRHDMERKYTEEEIIVTDET